MSEMRGDINYWVDRAEKADAALDRVRALADKPHVVQVETLDGMVNAPCIWPHEVYAALDGPGESGRVVPFCGDAACTKPHTDDEWAARYGEDGPDG